MSHVATVELHVTDLEALKEACQQMGLEFVEGQQTFKWYGTHVGDYPLPLGFNANDMGKCQHAIRLPDNPRAYEVGVVPRRDGKPGYLLMYDFWQKGHGLEAAIGQGAKTLKQQYAAQVAVRQVRKQGFRVAQTVTETGAIRLICTR